jgi:TatD DNase family protein
LDLIDIGVNLTDRRFDADRELVLQRAIDAGVGQLILTGTTEAESREAADLARTRPGVLYSTAGVHPHNARLCSPTTIREMRTLWERDEVVAIGETGLDFNRDFSPRPDQERWFGEQVALAVELDAPLFLHEREAHDRFISILANQLPTAHRAVVHCFTGAEAELRAYLDAGLHIGITGWICDERRGATLQELVRFIPPDRLMVETDAPWLLPRDLRPKPKKGRNEPAFLPHIVRRIAACRGESPQDTATQALVTTRRFFGLSDPVVQTAA